MAKYSILYWQEIPSVVEATDGAGTSKQQLSSRFQELIDLIAMKRGLAGTDAYLEGIRDTWVASNELAKELGHIEDYAIYGSQLPASGDFNLLLVIKFADTEDLAPSKQRYNEFMEKWSDEQEKRSEELVKNYPAMRDITGSYLMREITMK